MSKQLNLLDVPKDSPSHAERLNAFCEREKIWTHNCVGMVKRDEPWIVMILPGNPRGIEIPYEEEFVDPFEHFAGYCRLMESYRIMATGMTKREAVERLCAALTIPFDL